MEKKGKKKEEDLLISCRTSFQFLFFVLSKVSGRLEPLRFVIQEHSPMLSEAAWYKSVVFCR